MPSKHPSKGKGEPSKPKGNPETLVPGLKQGQARDILGRIVTKKDDQLDQISAVGEVPGDPEDVLASMKRVLAGQPKEIPLDAAYKDWLARDPKGFMAEKRRLEVGPEPLNPAGLPMQAPRPGEDCPLCGGEAPLKDEGSEHAIMTIESLLEQANTSARVGVAVSDAWEKLSEADRAVIVRIVPEAGEAVPV